MALKSAHLLKSLLQSLSALCRRGCERSITLSVMIYEGRAFGSSTREVQVSAKARRKLDFIFHPDPILSPSHCTPPTMLSRAFRRSIAPQFRRNAFSTPSRTTPFISAFRSVTTDAASSHADKEAVPEVSKAKSITSLRRCSATNQLCSTGR